MRGSIQIPSTLLMLALCLLATSAAAQPEVGGTAPGFELPALDGSSVSLADLRDRFVVLHFGAGW